MMRKFVLVVSLLILSVGLFVGCKDEPSISCSLKEISLYQNQEYSLPKDSVKIENYEDGFNLSIKDKNIAKIVNNKIVPVSIGETKLVISLDGYSEVSCEVALTINEGYIAEWITTDYSTITINKELNPSGINRVYVNKSCTEVPSVSYDAGLIDYNYKTGVITAKNTGKTTVRVKYIQCEISFDVVVTNVVYTEAMIVNNATIFKNTTGTINFSIFPSSANTYRFWTNSSLLDINNEGVYQTYGVGTAIVYYQYYTSYNQLSTVYSFEVIIADSYIEYELEIVDENFDGTANYLLDKNYYLVIDCNNTVNCTLFTFSNNIELKSNIFWRDNLGYVCKFVFKDNGNTKIDVYYTPSEDLSLQLIRSKVVNVYSENDIRLVAKWSAYMQSKIDGKYRIFIKNTSMLPDSLEFRLYLGEKAYNQEFELYLVGENNELTLINKTFKPTEIGEYTLVAKIGENVIDTVIVVADYE